MKLFMELIGRIFLLSIVIMSSVFYSLRRRLGFAEKEWVWLIGENRGDCVCDNGYFFYRYCRLNHSERKKIYFVVKKSSSLFKELSVNDDHVLTFGSLRHAMVFSRTMIGLYTHTYSDLIYRRIYEISGGIKKLVFLHHGVLGFKKFNDFYRKKRAVMDVFTVGNKLEEEILRNQEGVPGHKLRLTGYARYDYLYNTASSGSPKIVYISRHTGIGYWKIFNRPSFTIK